MDPNRVKFYVNKQKRKVVCVISGTKWDFINFAEDFLRISPKTDAFFCTVNDINSNKTLYNKLKMPNLFVGKATCGPDDEFNAETGKAIAYARAKANLDKSFFKRANTYINSIDEWLTDAVIKINNYGKKLSKNATYRENRINYLLGVDDGNKKDS